ncbi:MAG: hypothetical protein ACXVRI_13710, partial [Gaiellaceae bacterium]
TTLFEEIATLLASPGGGSDAPALERLEDALTTGYAHALALETELASLRLTLKELRRRAMALRSAPVSA